jgi:hypothetical protein
MASLNCQTLNEDCNLASAYIRNKNEAFYILSSIDFQPNLLFLPAKIGGCVELS